MTLPFSLPTIIADRFEIESLAGTGGMGTVYRARDRHTGRAAAVKLLQDAKHDDMERFAREATVLAELRHPAVVRYVAHGATLAGDPYLAMEWLDGEDLQDRLRREGLTASESVRLVMRVAEALAVAHAHGVVHRDIKPSNIFLPDRDIAKVKLLDFGIARLTASRRATRTGMLLGTPGYMSPEQARGGMPIDARTDVFALGCVLFECLTGRAAFVGETIMAVLAKILFEEAPRVSELRDDLPPALDDLVARMLAKDAAQRPVDGAAVTIEFAQLGAISQTKRPRAAAPSNVAITIGEQRLLSVVVAGAGLIGGAEPDADTVSVTLNVPGTAPIDAVRAAVAPFGAHAETIASGTTVVMITGSGAATDQAAHAARCALAVRSVLSEAPIALATGRGELSARWPMGQAIDRAAKLLRAAPPESGDARPIRIDDVTAGLLDARFDLRGDAGGLLLCGERQVPEDARRLLGKETTCVGREREIGTLEAIFAECEAEPVARAVLVTAAAGFGKSRLRYEFLRKVVAQSRAGAGGAQAVQVWIGRGDPMSAGSPFGMLAKALRRAFGVIDAEPREVAWQKLRAHVSRNLAEDSVSRVAEFLGELVAVPAPADVASAQLHAARQDAILMGDQMRRALEEWLVAECTAQPVLLVLEDLHWGDLPTVAYVDSALRTLRELPFMVLALARPEVHALFPKLWGERELQEIRLGALTKKASEKLVREALGPAATPDVVARLVKRAEGNAFFLEELIRAVSEGRGEALPETVLAMLQGRLERLQPEARRVLRAASVFGQLFWRGGVASLLGGASRAADLDAWLEVLEDAEVIASRGAGRFGSDVEYMFRHALVREAAYAMLTEKDRGLGHLLAGEWLESAGERDGVALAEHFERGGDAARASAWYGRAAQEALEGNDLDAAIARAQKAIACGATGDARGKMRALEAEARSWRGDAALAAEAAAAAIHELPAGSAAWFAAAGIAATATGASGANDRLAELSERALAQEPLEGARAAKAVALARASVQLVIAGRYDAADRMIEGIAPVRDRAVPATIAWEQRARAWRAVVRGDLGAAGAAIEQSARAFAEAGDLRSACMQQGGAGYVAMQVGMYRTAERCLREAFDAAERLGLHHVASVAMNNLGLVRGRLGAVEEGMALEMAALEMAISQKETRMEGGARVYLALLMTAAGDHAQAALEAQTAVEVLTPVRPARAFALAVLAHVLLASGRPDAALLAAREGMELLAVLGGIEEGEALLRLSYAEALSLTGSLGTAWDAISTARDRLMTRAALISDPQWRASFLSDVPENARTLTLAKEWVDDAPRSSTSKLG